jgi:circadian clock protein KaiC
MEFLVQGARRGEPGVFMSFEEKVEDLRANFATIGFDLAELEANNDLMLDSVQIDSPRLRESGGYSLEPILIRLGQAIDRVGARRVVLDTIGALFARLSNRGQLRSEMQRLIHWLGDRGVTSIVTAEKGDGDLTRFGIEEYVSDCVIVLDHRVHDQVSKRRLRVLKYRGSAHGDDEYPFLISETGISVLPITALRLDHPAPQTRMSTGIAELDAMMGGQGYFRGSSILVTGTAGTGKTSMAVQFVEAVCRRGNKALYLSFEESEEQVVRNLKSLSIDLQPHLEEGRLSFCAERPASMGLEEHLLRAHRLMDRLDPEVVVLDPVTNFLTVGNTDEVKAMLTRLLDSAKQRGTTVLATSLTTAGQALERTNAEVSSLMDVWLVLRDYWCEHENRRLLYVLKSRGMAHSRSIMELLITDSGLKLREPTFEVVHAPRIPSPQGG